MKVLLVNDRLCIKKCAFDCQKNDVIKIVN